MKKPFEHFEVKESDSISLKTLQKLVEKHKDPTFGTYDYDGIVVEVMRLVGDITEAKYLASARKAKQQKQVIKLVTK